MDQTTAIADEAALNRLAVRALSRLPLDDLLTEGLRLVLDTLDADDVRLVEPIGAGGVMLSSLDQPRRTDDDQPAERFRDVTAMLVDSGLVAAALATDEPLAVPDLRTTGGAAAVAGVAGALLVPVRTHDHGACVLGVFNARARVFDRSEIDFASQVAAILGGAIDIRWTEDVLRWRSQLDHLLTEVSTSFIDLPTAGLDVAVPEALARIATVVGAEHAAVFVRDESDESVVLGEWSLPNAATGLELIELRMLTPHRAIGHIVFGMGSKPVPWRGDIAVALQPFADIIAQAVTYEGHAVALTASESRYRSLVEEVRDVIVRVDATGRIGFVNQAWTELTGLSEEDTLSRNCFESIHPDDQLLAAEHIESVMRGEDNAARSVRFIAKDGSFRWMEVKGRALFDGEGNFTGLSGVLHDVTENVIAETKIRAALAEAVRARKEAERSSSAKSEFLSRMSHELRTPLNAILGFAQLLGYASLSDEDMDSLRLIGQAGQHLLALVNDTLDISRTDTGDLALTMEAVPVGEVWQECLDFLGGEAATRAVTIQPIEDTDRGVLVLADRRRLTQVMVNLMSNAIKYNLDGGTITVATRFLAPEEGPTNDRLWVRISVTDTGRGVPADRVDDVFVPFDRLGAELTEVEGTGIGLALAKSLVEAMGGRIGLTSVEGQGSTFYVDLPAGPESST